MSQPALSFDLTPPTATRPDPPVVQEIKRRNAARDRVVAYLTAHGTATNVELCRPECGGNRGVGRLWEAQRLGEIAFTKSHVKGGVWRYTFVARQGGLAAVGR